MFINAVRLGEEVFIRACHQTDVDPIWEAYNPFTGIWETLYVQERDGLPLQRISRADFGERFATVLTGE